MDDGHGACCRFLLQTVVAQTARRVERSRLPGPTAYYKYKPVLATRKPTGEAGLPACLPFQKDRALGLVRCMPKPRRVSNASRFFLCDEIAALLSHKTCTTTDDSERRSCWPKNKQQPARHEPATVDLGAQRSACIAGLQICVPSLRGCLVTPN